MKRLSIGVFAAGLLAFLITVVIGISALGFNFFSARGQWLPFFLQTYSVLLLFSLFLVAYVYLLIGLNHFMKRHFHTRPRSKMLIKWPYEVKLEVSKFLRVGLLSIFLLVLVVGFLGLNLTGGLIVGILNMVFYFYLIVLLPLSMAVVSEWVQSLEGVTFWLEQFIRNTESQKGYDLNRAASNEVNSLRKGLTILSLTRASLPKNLVIDVNSLCSNFEEFLIVADENSVRTALSRINELLNQLKRKNMTGVWSSLLDFRKSTSSYAGKDTGTFVRIRSIGSRIWNVVKSERFWVDLTGLIVLTVFLLGLFGTRIPLPV
jgi:hypothetical protein